MPHPIFDITADSIAPLDEREFVDLCNRLLQAEGAIHGMKPDEVGTSLRVKDPDGGVDARTENAPTSSRWLPSGLTVWQCKSGKSAEPKDLKKEFKKPGVQAALKAGGSYVVLLGEDLTDKKRQSRVKALKECCDEQNLTHDRCRIFDASHIAQWVSEYPVLTFWQGFQRPSPSDWMRWEELASQKRFSVAFQSDPQRDDIIESIRTAISAPATTTIHHRIEGLAGFGKTRLSLEILRSQGLSERTMYAGQDRDIPQGFWTWMRNSPASIMLVVDECSRETSENLAQQAETCDGRVRLVTIGLSQQVNSLTQPNTFQLGKLEREAMLAVIQTVAPQLSQEARDVIVEVSSGYVKLAVGLAKAIQTHPTAPLRDLAGFPDVNELIEKFLVPDPINRRVMKAIALLPQIGWDDDLAGEGECVTNFLNLDWQDARSRVRDLTRTGYVAKSGRYRYITPHLLAVWLAGEVWDDQRAKMLSLLPRLPTLSSRRGLIERLRDLGEDPHAREVAESLLGGRGLFPDIDALNDNERAQIFGLLTEAAPQAGMVALNRLLGHLSHDGLLNFSKGRRQVVWTLEKLAWLPETFSDAAHLVLALAEAENEHWANNASGLWPALFGTYLGGTAVPALERQVLIREALESGSETRAKLAVRAISSVLNAHEVRSHSGDKPGGRIVPPEWHPDTWETAAAVKRAGLILLDSALESPFDSVKEAARKLLLDMGRQLVRQELTEETLIRWQRVDLTTYEQRREMQNRIGDVLEFDGDFLTPQQKSELEKFAASLKDDSFGERLRYCVAGRTRREAWELLKNKNNDHDEIAIEADRLAEESMTSPELLSSEIDYLASLNNFMLFPFAARLGQADEDWFWWPKIESHVQQGEAQEFAAAYLFGQVKAGRGERREEILDDWMKQGQPLATALLRVTQQNPDGITDEVVQRFIDLLKAGWVKPSQVGQPLGDGKATSSLSTHTFRELIDVMQQTASVQESSVEMSVTLSWIYDRLASHPQEQESLSPLVWKVFEAPDIDFEELSYSVLKDGVLEPWVLQQPRRMARAVLVQLGKGTVSHRGEHVAMETLKSALQIDSTGVWEEVAEKLSAPHKESLQLMWNLRGHLGSWIEAEVLLDWAKEHKNDERAPLLVADMAPVNGDPLHPLARGLIIEFGSDSKAASSLYSTFCSGSWIGPMSNYLEGNARAARVWLSDEHPNVRAWAQKLVRSLEAQIQDARLREEEEQLLMGNR